MKTRITLEIVISEDGTSDCKIESAESNCTMPHLILGMADGMAALMGATQRILEAAGMQPKKARDVWGLMCDQAMKSRDHTEKNGNSKVMVSDIGGGR